MATEERTRMTKVASYDSSVWLVQFSLPRTQQNGHSWRQNVDRMVVAPTLESALAGVREEHPEATFHSVHRRGTDKTILVVEV